MDVEATERKADLPLVKFFIIPAFSLIESEKTGTKEAWKNVT